jgi:glucose-6-phosphate 1-dehydrogenase
MVELAWRVVQPVLDAWAAEKANFPDYPSGSDGPTAADALLAGDGGRAWRQIVPSSGTNNDRAAR